MKEADAFVAKWKALSEVEKAGDMPRVQSLKGGIGGSYRHYYILWAIPT